MPDSHAAAGIGAGLLIGVAVLAAGGVGGSLLALRSRLGMAAGIRVPWTWWCGQVERSGWKEPPERVAAAALALAVCPAVLVVTTALALAPLVFMAGVAVCLVALNAAVAGRRRKLCGELVPLLELFTLELSGGGSALAALGSVTVQVDGELATSLRSMLIASQVGGSASFEARLIEYAERERVPALATLATILGASRDFGTGATQGARALATDLRRAQRRELIAHSRRALNHVLLPAAICVLLPFLGVLMFPAVSVLQRSLR